jgi:hypothetical protein
MMQVQLPAGFTCTNCVLQITEFMSAHDAPCYYHHCAIVTISDDPSNPPIGGDSATAMSDDGGCCSTSRGSGASALLGLIAGALILRRSHSVRSRTRSVSR